MDLPVRKPNRLRGYDYSQSGYYFITICTRDRLNLFGKVIVGADSISARMQLNDAGRLVDEILNQTIHEFQNIELIHYVIMPNHIHLILGLTRADMESAPTISKVIQSFKRNTTIKYIDGVKEGIYPPFNKQIWQRSYHDRVIRSEAEYLQIWQYVEENPARWQEDCYFA